LRSELKAEEKRNLQLAAEIAAHGDTIKQVLGCVVSLEQVAGIEKASTNPIERVSKAETD
jgi:hypothetical protein